MRMKKQISLWLLLTLSLLAVAQTQSTVDAEYSDNISGIKNESDPIIPVVWDGFEFGIYEGSDTFSKIFDLEETNFYEAFGIEKEKFHNNYYIESSENEFAQYSFNGFGFIPLSRQNYYGKIQEYDKATNKYCWIMSESDIERISDVGNVKIYLKFLPLIGSESENPVFIALKVTLVELPAGTLKSKLLSSWFRDETTCFINTPPPTYSCNPPVTSISTNLNNAWYHMDEGKMVFGPQLESPVEGFTGMKYYFTSNQMKSIDNVAWNDGKYYSITLSVDSTTGESANEGQYTNNKIYANGPEGKVVIAILDQSSGIFTYENNATSAALINHYGSGPRYEIDRPEAQLAFNVGICCYNPENNKVLKLTNGTYDVVVLRPINVAPIQGVVFNNNYEDPSSVNIYDCLTISDWRFFECTNNNSWLLGYYDITGTKVDIANIKSDYSGLMSINQDINSHFTYVPGPSVNFPIPLNPTSYNFDQIVRAELGTITWDNKDLTVSTFNVEIPVAIEYAWGSIHFTMPMQIISTYKPDKPVISYNGIEIKEGSNTDVVIHGVSEDPDNHSLLFVARISGNANIYGHYPLLTHSELRMSDSSSKPEYITVDGLLYRNLNQMNCVTPTGEEDMYYVTIDCPESGLYSFVCYDHDTAGPAITFNVTVSDGTSGIEIMENNTNEKVYYYDFQGRKISNPSKGAYIKMMGNNKSKVIIN